MWFRRRAGWLSTCGTSQDIISAGSLDCLTMTNRRDLFPPIDPYQTGSLRLDGRHTMYWEQSGTPRGAPALFLHGGPGAGATPGHRRLLGPERWQIVVC